MAINYVPLRNVYPTAPGYTLGQIVSGASPYTPPEAVAMKGASEVQQAAEVGGQANPIAGLLVFGALLVGVTLAARHLGGPEEFRSIRGSFYDVVWVSLAAVAGIPLWKFVFTRVKVPGVSAWVLSV
jgi:hypothetical protein